MATQKPLKQMLPELMAHIKIVQNNQTIFEKKIMEIYEGQLQKHVEASISAEFASKTAAKRAIERIAPINILPKLMSKVSQVYTLGVSRISTDNQIDSELLSFYSKSMNLDCKLNTVNKLVSMLSYCAVEPYLLNGEPKLRILPPTQFTVYSDNPINPLDPTVFIKYMGKTPSLNQPRTDSTGKIIKSAQTVIEDVDLFYIYSDDEFIVVDSESIIRYNIMDSLKNPDGVNPLGQIPFVYINSSEFNLIPVPKQDMLSMPILIPKLLTDMNYATKFQSHAIVYSIDLDTEKMESNPDSMWNLKSNGDSEKTGSIGTIKPEVDVDKVLSLIHSELTLWMESLGIKSSGIGQVNVTSAASGIAKAIDEADISNIRNNQKKFFTQVEANLWSLISNMHKYWSSNAEIETLNLFSSNFNPLIVYGEATPYVDPLSELEVIKLKLDNNLTSYKRALMTANPELDEEEIQELMLEIDNEKLTRSLRAISNLQSNAEDDNDD